MADRSKETTHKIMSSIKQKDTEPELLLRKALWSRGLRYRKNVKSVLGKPDVVFTKERIAIFCDGDFWHGLNWAVRGLGSLEDELSSYSDFWREKISRNVDRDKAITTTLESEGWLVVRLWESEIRNNLDDCVERVIDLRNKRRK